MRSFLHRGISPVSLAILALALLPGIRSEAADPDPATDDRIETTFKSSYVNKTYLKSDSVVIDSKGGVVTLTGKVAQESHKELAGETAGGLPGVSKVDNQIEVVGERPSELSDAWVNLKVNSMLMFHKSVSSLKTDVEVVNGVVTLKGEASSEAQKELTGEYAKDVDGVKQVKNEMIVMAKTPAPGAEEPKKTPEETIDDVSITAQIKTSLRYHRSTSALKTTVRTEEGVVTLAGKAKNQAEKDLAGKLAADIAGVKKVVNNMTVEEAPAR